MKSLLRALTSLALAVAVTVPLAYEVAGQAARPQTGTGRPAGPPPTSFREDVMPIFRGYCTECHQPGGEGFEKSGVDLRTYEGVMKGTKHGAMIVPKEPEFSSLMALLDGRVSPEIRMPHHARQLPASQRATIRRWILEGAQNN